MTKRKIRQAKWFGLFVAAFALMATVGTVWLWTLPLSFAAMIFCYRKGELWDAGEMK